MKINYKLILDKIKQKYHSREVSALVGAGFSKNIAKEYPSWQQLLYDMVVWLYKHEIEEAYTNHLHLKRNSRIIIDKKAIEEEAVRKIIDREGYLDIVSQFIKKKGFREAIEVYIEERIPSVRYDKRDLFIAKENKSIPLNTDGIDLFKIFLDGFWENIFTTNYDHLLEYVSKLSNKQWENIITNDYQLTSGNNKSIIKIHGHLRGEEDNIFGFDNDFSIRYIISKEDYDVYPTKHEAFTQLMRISLLKGIFCLFGFSGDDPNFLAWVRWVRDIIVKNPNERLQNSNDYKIFLISLDEDSPSNDKLQFYKNHRIVIIPLKNHDVKEAIGAPSEEQNPIVLFKCFFNYLYNTESKKDILIERESYSSLWASISEKQRIQNSKNLEYKITLNDSVFKKIIETKTYNRLVKDSYFQIEFLSDLKDDISFTIDKSKLAVIAFEDTLHSLEWYKNINKNIDDFLGNLDGWNIRYIKLKERDKSLAIKYTKDNRFSSPIYYERVLRAAFTLNFKELKTLLDEWETNNEDEQKRAGFYSIIDINNAIAILNTYLHKEVDEKEKNYAQQQIDYLANFKLSYDAHDNIIDYRDVIIKSLSNPKLIKPYGSIDKREENKKRIYRTSFKLLQFLIETGWQNSRNGLTFIGAETLYEAFYNLFEDYPYPVLYYILQYGSYKDVLKRMGQDFAYSDSLQMENVNILEMLFFAYFSESTPPRYKKNILWIASELLISVSPSKWKEDFMQIWEKDILDKWKDIWHNDSLDYFIKQGLPYLDFKGSKKVIIDCIQNRSIHSDTSLEYLYHHYNSLKRNAVRLKKDAELGQAINSFIENIEEDADFMVAGNIFNLLTKEQLNNIANKIKTRNTEKKINSRALRTMSFFAAQDSEICKVYKKIILNSPYLWHNGLKNEDSATPPNFINIDDISKNIKWNKSELSQIYSSLCHSFERLRNSSFLVDRDDSFFSNTYVSLLDKMYSFLIKNKEFLSTKKNYNQIITDIENTYITKRGFTQINEALISDDHSIVINGVNLLIREIELWGWDGHEKLFNLLINRILLKNREAFLYCLSSIVYLLKYYTNESVINNHIPELSLIIQIYQDEDLILDMKLNKAETYYYMIKIAEFLKNKSIDSDYINFWIDLQKTKRFNNFSRLRF
jgi:hypothetical protein